VYHFSKSKMLAVERECLLDVVHDVPDADCGHRTLLARPSTAQPFCRAVASVSRGAAERAARAHRAP
jgi:hypothetical protein